ncbi:hypothetical protein DENIT_12754 [Pseudomonas veronii]|nr:hypothetical protein DENIT_12754 [Pseudomonas veronii]
MAASIMTSGRAFTNDKSYQIRAVRTKVANTPTSCGKVAKAANLDRVVRHTVDPRQQNLTSLLKCPPF